MKRTIAVNARFLCYNISGIQRFAIELCRQLKQIDPGIVFLAPRTVIQKDIADELGVITIGRRTGYLWEQVELPRYLKKHGRPLLVNLSNTAPVFYKPKTVTLHDVAFMHNPSWFSRRFYYVYRIMIPLLLKTAERVVTVSEFSRSEIHRYFHTPLGKIHVVYNAVADFFLTNKKHAPSPEDGDYILTVSSIDPRKNIDMLIKSFDGMDIPVRLVIIGESKNMFSNYTEKEHGDVNLRNNVDGRIIFTGYLTDDRLIAYYQNAKAFLYISKYEGFGIPPLEAMALGCPTIVSNAASLPEACGDASLYVDPESNADIQEAIRTISSDTAMRKRLIKKGLERVRHFSWKKSAEELYIIIKATNPEY